VKSSYGARLEVFLNLKKIKRTALSIEFGKSANVVGDWIRGKANPPLPNLEILHLKYGLNLNWLVTGIGKMVLDEDINTQNIESNNASENNEMLESLIESNRLLSNSNFISTTNTEKLLLMTDRLTLNNQLIVDTNTQLAKEVIALKKAE